MPVLIDQRACDNSAGCSAARVCPSGAVRWFATDVELEAAQKAIAASKLTQDDLLEQRYGIRPGDPGELVDQAVGALPKEAIRLKLDAVVAATGHAR